MSFAHHIDDYFFTFHHTPNFKLANQFVFFICQKTKKKLFLTRKWSSKIFCTYPLCNGYDGRQSSKNSQWIWPGWLRIGNDLLYVRGNLNRHQIMGYQHRFSFQKIGKILSVNEIDLSELVCRTYTHGHCMVRSDTLKIVLIELWHKWQQKVRSKLPINFASPA